MVGCFVGFEDLQPTADKGYMIGLRFRCDPEVRTKNSDRVKTVMVSRCALRFQQGHRFCLRLLAVNLLPYLIGDPSFQWLDWRNDRIRFTHQGHQSVL